MHSLTSKLILCFSLIIFGIVGVSSQQTADSLSIELSPELLFAKSQERNYRISPNGKLFLEVLKNGIENEIVILDIDGYKLKHKFKVGFNSINEVNWLSNKRLIYEVKGKIYAVDIDGENKIELVGNNIGKQSKDHYKRYKNYRYNSVLSLQEEIEDVIIIQSFDNYGYASVHNVNVFTGEKELVKDGRREKMNMWILDKNNNIILGAKVIEEQLTFYEESKSNDWKPLDIIIDGESNILKIEGSTFLDQNLVFVETDYDPEVIYLAENITVDKRRLIKYNYKKKIVVAEIVKDVNCDVTTPESDRLSLIFDKNSKNLGGVRYTT